MDFKEIITKLVHTIAYKVVTIQNLINDIDSERISSAAEEARNAAALALLKAGMAENVVTNLNNAELIRVNVENRRINSESVRQDNETSRMRAENLRTQAEISRTTTAGNDHTTAQADHSQSVNDHAIVAVYVNSLGAFDISSYHATGGVLAKYADLTAALGTDGANIPDALRKGGMSVKFVQSSNNKYVQYFLPKDEWSVSDSDWEKMTS